MSIQSELVKEIERSAGMSIEDVRNMHLCDMLDYSEQRKKADQEVDRSLESLFEGKVKDASL
jgi:hypothetical protein